MIFDAREIDAPLEADVAVVGAGPAGIVTALELADAGLDVILLESGGARLDPAVQTLADAAEWDENLHAPLALAVRRQIGGTSAIWGGRCVPFDPVDFDRRPWVGDVSWPVAYDELASLFARACDWFRCGRPVFDATQTGHLRDSLVPGLPNGDVRTSALERWSLPTDFGREYRSRLAASPRLRLVSGATCTRIVIGDDGDVDHLVWKTLDGRDSPARARRYVVACGGLEGTRLLLASPQRDGRPVGDHSGHLGRWYMAHLEGVVARVRFATPPRETLYDYELDSDGVYVHRRISFSREFQRAEELPNVASWLVHPDLSAAEHESGILSFAYLALSSPLGPRLAPEALRLAMLGQRIPGVPYYGTSPSRLRRHLVNVARDAPATARFAARFGTRRFLARGRRVPGFAVYQPDNVYPLKYHGEHAPHRESRVTLSDKHDALGVPRLRVDVRFSQSDVDGIVGAHRHWDDYLRQHGCGRLEYLADDVADAVRGRLGAGFHQSGTTRMSERPEDGVVDCDLTVHGVPSLHVVSSSVFPTSSQANSTFMIVVFALRLAEHLRRVLSSAGTPL
jgi:choline dehydrogenase-like flavoprotein